jgi:ABC-2 type transport system permease protein
VWLRSIFFKTLRDYRVAILGWGSGIGMLVPMLFAGFSRFIDSPEGRAGLQVLARNPAVRLFGEPVDIVHAGGYATFRLSLLAPMMGVWALLAASRTLRGEEERGALDLLLSFPRSRLRIAAEKVAAIEAALLLMGLLIGVLAFAGGMLARVDLALSAAVLFGLNIALLASVFGALALLLSQFTQERRPAAGMSGAVLGLSFVLTGAGRTLPNGAWAAWASPIHYFELSKPLIPESGANATGMIVLAALSVVLSALAIALFVGRDVGAPVALPWRLSDREERPATSVPVGSWGLRSVFARSLRMLAAPTLWWGFVIAAYTALLTALLNQAQQDVVNFMTSLSQGNPVYAEMIARLMGGDIANSMLLNAIFTLLVVVFAAFALTLANRWAADEEEGRLELLLGTPQSRARVILSRFGAVVVALLVVAGLLFTGAALTAARIGMTLDASRLAQAAFGMVPVGLVVAAVGYLLSGWLRTVAVTGILIGLLLASFLLAFLGPLLAFLGPIFHVPKILLRVSIFEAYGAPLVDGLRPANTLGLLAVAAIALAIATVRFARKDIAS